MRERPIQYRAAIYTELKFDFDNSRIDLDLALIKLTQEQRVKAMVRCYGGEITNI